MHVKTPILKAVIKISKYHLCRIANKSNIIIIIVVVKNNNYNNNNNNNI